MGRKRVSGDCKRTAPVECSAPLYSPTECRLRRFDTWGLFTQRKASHPKIVSHVCLQPTESWLRRELATAIAARAECAARRRQLSQNVGYRVHRLQNVSPAGIVDSLLSIGFVLSLLASCPHTHLRLAAAAGLCFLVGQVAAAPVRFAPHFCRMLRCACASS